MQVNIVQADYHHPQHQQDIPYLLNAYALDPMGGGQPLTSHVQQNLVTALSKLPHAFTLLAYEHDTPVGLLNGFDAFSTFACQPLINIHDVIVLEDYRGHGIVQQLLATVEQMAKDKGCCKITLEVLSNNSAAKSAYQKFGFTDYALDPDAGTALFWQKPL